MVNDQIHIAAAIPQVIACAGPRPMHPKAAGVPDQPRVDHQAAAGAAQDAEVQDTIRTALPVRDQTGAAAGENVNVGRHQIPRPAPVVIYLAAALTLRFPSGIRWGHQHGSAGGDGDLRPGSR